MRAATRAARSASRSAVSPGRPDSRRCTGVVISSKGISVQETTRSKTQCAARASVWDRRAAPADAVTIDHDDRGLEVERVRPAR
jgi:hypothetical protein